MKPSPLRAWLTAGALAFAACGPNYRYVYDGESAFERCYAFDYDPNVPVSSRASCWTSWLQSYQFGASADRVEYARGRAANPGTVPGLSAPPPSNGIATPAPSATSTTPPAPTPTPAPPVAALVAPQPPVTATNPAVVGRAAATQAPGTNETWQRAQISSGGNPVGAPPPTSTQSATGSEPPGASCAADCRNAWSASAAQCVSRDAACTARSDETYRDCMRGCF